MGRYYDNLMPEIKEYFQILSPEGYPEWIDQYVSAPEMQRLSGVGMYCGTELSPMYEPSHLSNTLDHSVGVALIVWNFTHDKKQALAGLFHDIATPTFKHCVDYMNGDSEKQESTEERTEEMIRNSKVISELLKRDNLTVEDVADYHKYPIADNDTPRLSADRLEYTLSNALFFFNEWDLNDVKWYYTDLYVAKNEDGEDEISFFSPEIAESFVYNVLPMFATYNSDQNRTIMQFLGDIMKSLAVKGKLTADDMYLLKDEDVLDVIYSSGDDYIINAFDAFRSASDVWGANEPKENKYSISAKGKKRYIVPLANIGSGTARITDVFKDIKHFVQGFHDLKRSRFTGFDFDFKPYEFEKNMKNENQK